MRTLALERQWRLEVPAKVITTAAGDAEMDKTEKDKQEKPAQDRRLRNQPGKSKDNLRQSEEQQQQ